MIILDSDLPLVSELNALLKRAENKDTDLILAPVKYLTILRRLNKDFTDQSDKFLSVNNKAIDNTTLKNRLNKYSCKIVYSWVHNTMFIDKLNDNFGQNKTYKYSIMGNISFNKKICKYFSLVNNLDYSEDQFIEEVSNEIFKGIIFNCKKYIQEATKNLMDGNKMNYYIDDFNNDQVVLNLINSSEDFKLMVQDILDSEGNAAQPVNSRFTSILSKSSSVLYPINKFLTGKNGAESAVKIINGDKSSRQRISKLSDFEIFSLAVNGFDIDIKNIEKFISEYDFVSDFIKEQNDPLYAMTVLSDIIYHSGMKFSLSSLQDRFLYYIYKEILKFKKEGN